MEAPIFIFSLPRSGSTLLQRILMSHPEIKSVSEPWVLLPLIYLNKKEGTLTEYSHIGAYRAISDFISNLPQKEKDYNHALKEFVSNLYSKQCSDNERYFLDKTPRYYLIIDEIVKIFPDAKFIFLFRNPIQILSSIIQTFSNGGFKQIHGYKIDMESGISKLSKGYSKNKENSFAVNYEKLVLQPKTIIKELCGYLDIEYNSNMLNNFSMQETKGKFGDPTGTNQYSSIEKETLNKWKSTFNTRIRVKFVLNYIKNLDTETLAIQGYSKDDLVDDIMNIKAKRIFSFKDLYHIKRGKLITKFKLNLFLGKTKKVYKERYLT